MMRTVSACSRRLADCCFVSGAVAVLAVVFMPQQAKAQMVGLRFPDTLPGYSPDTSGSVAMREILSNIHPGIPVGDYIIQPNASQSFGYDSNILGAPHTGGADFNTSASVSVRSNWRRHAIGVSAGVQNVAYPTLSQAGYTNWNASAGTSLDVGRDQVSFGYTHSVKYLTATEPGNFGISYPAPYTVNDFRVSYRKNWSRFALIPEASYDKFSFNQGAGTSAFTQRDMKSLGHQLETQGLQGRFEISRGNAVIAVLRGTEAQFVPGASGSQSMDYISGGGFVGLDMRASAVLQYRALVGGETRHFVRSAIPAITTPTTEVEVVWMPDRMNTLTLRGERGLFDPTSPFSQNQVMSTVRVQYNHEFRRYFYVQAYAEMEKSDAHTQPGNEIRRRTARQTQFNFNVSANWKINRDFTLSLQYSHYSSYTKHGIASMNALGHGRSTYTGNMIGLEISYVR